MKDTTVAVYRSITCTCCGRRGARVMVRLGTDHPHFVGVCPVCDTQPDTLPGWTASADDPRR